MEDHITPLKTGIRYGGFLGLAMIVLTLVAHYTGWQDFKDLDSTSSIIVEVVTHILGLGITIMGILYYRSNNEGLLTFGEGISVSLFIGLFAGVIGAIFMYIFASYIAPDIGEAVLSTIDIDEMSEDEAEAVEQVMGFATSPVFLAFSQLIGSILLGLIYGLIGSLILKKG